MVDHNKEQMLGGDRLFWIKREEANRHKSCTDLLPDVTADAEHGNLQRFWSTLTAVRKQVWAVILSVCKHDCGPVHFTLDRTAVHHQPYSTHSPTPRNNLLSPVNLMGMLLHCERKMGRKTHMGTRKGVSHSQAPKLLTMRWQCWPLQSHVTVTFIKIKTAPTFDSTTCLQ